MKEVYCNSSKEEIKWIKVKLNKNQISKIARVLDIKYIKVI